MGFNGGCAPVATGMNSANEKRPLSAFSVRIRSPEPLQESKLASANGNNGLLSPPPAYYESEPTYVEPQNNRGRKGAVNHLRGPSPASSAGSQSRSHSPFGGSSSPLPPVGDDLYHSNYITTPIPRSATPHMPAPSPQPSPTPSPNVNRKTHPTSSNWIYE